MTYDSVEDYERINHIKPKLFVPVYKCRMCGAKLLHHYRVLEEDKEKILVEMINSSCRIDPYSSSIGVNYISSKSLFIHNCKDGRSGVAELIGMEEFVKAKELVEEKEWDL